MMALLADVLCLSVRREMQDGHVQPALLQALPPQEVLRDRHEEGVHPHGRGEGAQAPEDRREQVSEEGSVARRQGVGGQVRRPSIVYC